MKTDAGPSEQGTIWGGGAVLFASMTLVNIANYAFNLILGRWLGPAAYADLNLIVTMALILVFVTTTLQMVGAKFFAGVDAAEHGQIRRWLVRIAWLVGALLGLGFIVGSSGLAEFFQSASPWPFAVFGLGLPFYLAQSVDRGLLQGTLGLSRLALTYQAETWTRLVIGVGAVALGWGVVGAVSGITLSFVATWLVARPRTSTLDRTPISARRRAEIKAFAGAVGVALLGEIIFSHSDLLVVKRFFPPAEAGQYAAVAIIGRVVFYAPWAIIATMFPTVAKRQARGEAHRNLLYGSFGLVLLMATTVTVITALFPDAVMNLLFGSEYLAVAPLLWKYALATTFFTLGNLVVHYELSADRSFGSWLTLVAGVSMPIVLWFVHSTLDVVIEVQLWIMGAFFLAAIIWSGLGSLVARTQDRPDVDDEPIDDVADR